MGDIRASMLEEVDFRKEAINIEALRISKVFSFLADQYRCLAYLYLRPLHRVWS